MNENFEGIPLTPNEFTRAMEMLDELDDDNRDLVREYLMAVYEANLDE